LRTGEWRLAEEHRISTAHIDDLRRECNASRSEVLLVAYSSALTLANECREKILVTALSGQQIFPVRLSAPASCSFRDVLERTQASLKKAKCHQLFSLRAIINLLQIPEQAMPHPVFAGAYLESDEIADVSERLKFPEQAFGGLDLMLRVDGHPDYTGVQFLYAAARHSEEWVQRLGSALAAVMNAAVDDPGVLLEQIEFGEHFKSGHATPETAPQFAF
jgi:hypothetical protein